MKRLKILICGGGRYESQSNADVRDDIASGWAQVVGSENVIVCNITGATSVVAAFRPAILLASGSYLPESTYFGELSRAARDIGAVPVFWATEDPYEQDSSYRVLHDFDVIFSSDRWGVNFYDHPRARHLALAGSVQSHYVPYDRRAARPTDVMFCGVAFSSRQEVVTDLLPHLSGLKLNITGPGWASFGAGFSDRRLAKPELIQLYATSKIILNIGRSLHYENRRHLIAPSSPGPRTFEAALAGCVQLFHEDTSGMRGLFSRDEIPPFSTPRQFRAQLDRLLGDGEARAEIATAAQRRALAEHTYEHRARSIIDVLTQEGIL